MPSIRGLASALIVSFYLSWTGHTEKRNPASYAQLRKTSFMASPLHDAKRTTMDLGSASKQRAFLPISCIKTRALDTSFVAHCISSQSHEIFRWQRKINFFVLLLGHPPGRPPSCNHLCCRPSALQDVNPLILGPTLVIFQPLTKYRHPLILCVVNFAGGRVLVPSVPCATNTRLIIPLGKAHGINASLIMAWGVGHDYHVSLGRG
ncbi:hypothetical protein GMDG_02425 [Pseudogymnoascus destructans 20631-21]|uniref:Secreted protein n=1 Tax=Pseudogymnoascus destructans (strain ATCC MYA-4855 / 20631-21) TaxID=658429 RepID=L8G3G7_PSED2|nr:hypothetical protein GMDG_02425 [Pseudogymnoascus destructans 20631-21]